MTWSASDLRRVSWGSLNLGVGVGVTEPGKGLLRSMSDEHEWYDPYQWSYSF